MITTFPPRNIFISALALLLLARTSAPAGSNSLNPPALKAGVEAGARTEWFRQAHFGLFIHWGLYAVLAGEWKGQPFVGPGEKIMKRATIPVKEYEQLARQFNPVKFNADVWAQLAQDAGMKYLTITAKHHDGFAMYHSKVSKYNIVDATPFGRDPMKELAAACAKRGIKFCFYYSQAQDWHEPGGIGNTWDFGPDEAKAADGRFDKYLEAKALPQVRELLTQYGPLGLIWFDTPRHMTAARATKFLKLVHELQPDCLINGRLGVKGDYRSMRDNQIPDSVVDALWETPATLNDSWGYKRDDHNWKSPAFLVYKLVDIVSKGGNYLLNVGPTAEGVIPEESVKVLHEVGAWLKINGEAIYGAGPTPFGREFESTIEENDESGRKIMASSDLVWRCTTQPGKFYFHIFTWPASGRFEIACFKGKVQRACLLAAKSRPDLKFSQADERLAVKLPPQPPDKLAGVLCVELKK